MIRIVKARAFANIALVKYWGKMAGGDNLPATSSISLALDVLATKTRVERIRGSHDRATLNGTPADLSSRKRISKYMDLWRQRGLISGHFDVLSSNSFPTAAGLASSASGFAALAKALSGFADKSISMTELSRLARIGSGSAARSIPGGLAALPSTKNSAARLILSEEKVPFGMVIAVVEQREKEYSSRVAMEMSRRTSPYYKSWLSRSRRDYKLMLSAIRRNDFTLIGETCEQNALCMHACMMATKPSLVYWTPATVRLIHQCQKMRSAGTEVYFTIDAGPNVALLCSRDEVSRVASRIRRIEGVKSALAGRPAGAAEIVDIQ